MAVSADQVPVVAVASGKGGVGKTTVAVNVALALSALGVRVGLVDADLYGPDAAHMMGLRRRGNADHVTLFAARGERGSRLQAAERHGVQIASAAFLIGEAQGLGVQAQLAQLLVRRLISGTSWDELDCLVVDLPPGMADIQQLVFTLGQRAIYALLVVTPQLVAHRDAYRLPARRPAGLRRCRRRPRSAGPQPRPELTWRDQWASAGQSRRDTMRAACHGWSGRSGRRRPTAGRTPS